MLRTLQAADMVGIRPFAVHVKDDEARAFYEHLGFSPLLSDPYHFFPCSRTFGAGLKS